MGAPNPVQTFLVEAEDLLLQIEEAALELREGEPGGELVHRLFRAFHTIKGSGAMFGFDRVAEYTHGLETTLDRYRTDDLPVTAELIRTVLAAKDEIGRMLAGGAAPAAVAGPAGAVAAGGEGVVEWRIGLRLAPDVLKSGGNPRLLLAELAALGECEARAVWDEVPGIEAIDPVQELLAPTGGTGCRIGEGVHCKGCLIGLGAQHREGITGASLQKRDLMARGDDGGPARHVIRHQVHDHRKNAKPCHGFNGR
jgi:two-component system chemotaxis sensor kinase CheA